MNDKHTERGHCVVLNSRIHKTLWGEWLRKGISWCEGIKVGRRLACLRNRGEQEWLEKKWLDVRWIASTQHQVWVKLGIVWGRNRLLCITGSDCKAFNERGGDCLSCHSMPWFLSFKDNHVWVGVVREENRNRKLFIRQDHRGWISVGRWRKGRVWGYVYV